jgi:hypothetical protein
MSIEEKTQDLTCAYAAKNLAQHYEIKEVKHPRLSSFGYTRQLFGNVEAIKSGLLAALNYLAGSPYGAIWESDNVDVDKLDPPNRRIYELRKKREEGIRRAGIISLEEIAALRTVEYIGYNLGYAHTMFLIDGDYSFDNPLPMQMAQGDFMDTLNWAISKSIVDFDQEEFPNQPHYFLPPFKIKRLDEVKIKRWVQDKVSERIEHGLEFDLFSSIYVKTEMDGSVSLFRDDVNRCGFDEFLSEEDKPEKPNYGWLRTPTIADFE